MSAKRRVKPPPNPVLRRARKGFRGYPVATVAYYGPDARRATKVAVGILDRQDGDVTALERWFSDTSDVRFDQRTNQAIADFITKHGAISVAMTDRIIGCPHEEGIDYPKGETCPHCPYWANRDRWTGELIE